MPATKSHSTAHAKKDCGCPAFWETEVRVIRFRDLVVSPWANGKGETRQLAIHADPAVHPAFLWRISMATVGAQAPFSPLPGIDRTISVLRGAGLELTINGQRQLLTHISPPFEFDGGAEASGGSLSGETLDLNVMTRRGFFRHHVKRVAIASIACLDVHHEDMFLVFTGKTKAQFGLETCDMDVCDTLCGFAKDTRISIHVTAPTDVFVVTLEPGMPGGASG
jgi:environmental stress-induced protein Ves